MVEYADSDGFWGHTFYVHEGVLRANSPFFDRALQLHWQEGKRGVVHLPEAEKEIFEIYAKWLYTGQSSKLGTGGGANATSWESICVTQTSRMPWWTT